MKFTLLLLLVFGLLSNVMAQHKINVKIDDYTNDTLILGYRLGKQTYVRDTLTQKNDKGEFVFEDKDETLEGGIYLILTKPSNTYFEFLVPDKEDQKDIRIRTKIINGNDMSTHLKIEGSADNKAFLDYLAFLRDMRAEDGKIAQEIGKEKNEDKKKELQLKREGLGKKVQQYQQGMIDKNPTFLSSALVKASIQPEVAADIKDDRTKSFYWYRKHFWDNFNFADERMIRTPIFQDKINMYTEKLTVQAPDSVINAIDVMFKATLAGKNDKMFQYIAAEMLNKYAKSKVICMDAVYVHIGKNYYCNGQASWVDSAQLEKICENVRALEPILCGSYAPNIALKKLDGTPIQLYDLKSKFTVIYFWDPTCGNCSKTSKKLVPVYNKYKKYGFEIFGICSKTWKELDQCKKKVEDQKMEFLNTSDDAYPLAVAKKRYDIKVNPFILLLDKDKKIMWKRIDPKQVDEILAREYKEMGIEIEVDPAIEKQLEESFKQKEKKNEQKVGVKSGGK